MKITGKQEKFAQLVAKGKEQSEAYRSSYDANNSKPETIHENASRVANDSKVTARIEELKKINAERNAITLDEVTEGIREAAGIASTKAEANALTNAYMALAKVGGLLIDKKDVKIELSAKDLLEAIEE